MPDIETPLSQPCCQILLEGHAAHHQSLLHVFVVLEELGVARPFVESHVLAALGEGGRREDHAGLGQIGELAQYRAAVGIRPRRKMCLIHHQRPLAGSEKLLDEVDFKPGVGGRVLHLRVGQENGVCPLRQLAFRQRRVPPNGGEKHGHGEGVYVFRIRIFVLWRLVIVHHKGLETILCADGRDIAPDIRKQLGLRREEDRHAPVQDMVIHD